MATLGNTQTPGTGFYFDDTGHAQFWTAFTMPSGGGTISDIYVYVGADGGNGSGELVIWGGNDSNNVLWQSSSMTFPGNSRTTGAQQWLHSTVPSVYQPAGLINLGFWSAGGCVWSFESFGGMIHQYGQNSGPGHIGSPGTEGGNAPGAYIVYTPGGNPVINTVTPDHGIPTNVVTLGGSSFTTTSGVTVGGVTASFTVNSDTSLSVTVPSGAPVGEQLITVTTSGGSASINFVVGEIWQGASILNIVNVWYGDSSGTPHIAKAVYFGLANGKPERCW